MTITNPARRPYRPLPHRIDLDGGLAFLAGAAVIGAAAWAYATRMLPVDAMLPAIGTVFFILAAVAAAIAWLRPQSKTGRFTYWDAAGALTLIGICAAAAVEPEQMVRLVAGNRQP